jgi:glycine/D-amino acid oxidase-like deaminating enzyme
VLSLPERVDVVIVGGGYTGLSAARTLATHGASVIVLERETFGWGASGRNGGFVLPGFKADIPVLVRRLGLATTRRLFEESIAAIGFLESLVTAEAISCDFHRPGYLTLAARPGHLPDLEATSRLMRREFGYETTLLSATELAQELGSRRYHGAVLEPAAGALQPAAYVVGLAAAAERAGALLQDHTAVMRVARVPGGFRVETSSGTLATRDVLIATNGYGIGLHPGLARRLVPVGSYIIATPPLEPSLAQQLIPRGRVLSDTKPLLYYFRLSPDRRLVFGGRAAFVSEQTGRAAAELRRGMLEVFPDLAETKVEFAWGGTLGMTLDYLPHIGRMDGVAYAMGYCGHGVALATWLGHRAGLALANVEPWPALAEVAFPRIPFYRGDPWFLPLAGMWYRMRDWVG